MAVISILRGAIKGSVQFMSGQLIFDIVWNLGIAIGRLMRALARDQLCGQCCAIGLRGLSIYQR